MALSKTLIKNDIKKFIEDLNSGDVTKKDKDKVIDDFSEKLAETIINAIKSADVTCTIPAGSVSTGVSPTVILLPSPLKITGDLK